MKKKLIKQIKDILLNNKRFLLIGHNGPDGDGLGSQIALKMVLEALGKKCTIWYFEKISLEKLDFLNIKGVVSGKSIKDDFDVVLAIDTASLDCIDSVRRDFIKDKLVINIDHHVSNTLYGNVNWVESDVSSAGEMVYEFIKEFHEIPLNNDILLAIYTAIATDTGGFKYANTSWKTHLVVSELLKSGLSEILEDYKDRIFDTLSLKGINLLSKVLKVINIDEQQGIVWCWLTQKMLDSSGASVEEADDVIRQVRSIKEAKVALVFRDHSFDGKIKLSLRSKVKKIDVNRVAKVFGGGGHKAAAGCLLEKADQKTIENKVLKEVRKEINRHIKP